MKKSENEWSFIFLKTLGASKGFLVEFNRQLAEQFLQATQINLQEENFSLAPVETICHDHNIPGVTYINCDLVFPDFFAYPAKIAWRCINDLEKKYDFKKESGDCQLEIFWLELPMQELIVYKKEKSEKKLNKPTPGWPDVHFEIFTQKEFTESYKKDLELYIWNWVERYNCSKENQNKIHYTGNLIIKSNMSAEIHIDFGEVAINLLNELVSDLSRYQNIKKINFS